MTNKSPRLPRKAFALPAPPAPPNSPALLPPAPPKQDSFALRVVEGIEDAALVEIKCDAPATKTAVELMVVLDISGSMSTECKVQDASGQAQKHGFSILDVCKHATRALAAATAAQAEGYPALPPAETLHGRLADALVAREKEMLRRGVCKGKTA